MHGILDPRFGCVQSGAFVSCGSVQCCVLGVCFVQSGPSDAHGGPCCGEQIGTRASVVQDSSGPSVNVHGCPCWRHASVSKLCFVQGFPPGVQLLSFELTGVQGSPLGLHCCSFESFIVQDGPPGVHGAPCASEQSGLAGSWEAALVMSNSPLKALVIRASRTRKREVHFTSVAGILCICVAILCIRGVTLHIVFAFLNIMLTNRSDNLLCHL